MTELQDSANNIVRVEYEGKAFYRFSLGGKPCALPEEKYRELNSLRPDIFPLRPTQPAARESQVVVQGSGPEIPENTASGSVQPHVTVTYPNLDFDAGVVPGTPRERRASGRLLLRLSRLGTQAALDAMPPETRELYEALVEPLAEGKH